MLRTTSIVLLVFVGVLAYLLLRPAWRPDTALDVTARCLVVSVEAPEEWKRQHTCTIRWDGKVITLPVAFRLTGAVENVQLGALPEIERALIVERTEIPVMVEPATDYRVSNEGGVGFVREPKSRSNTHAIGIVSWVCVSPFDQPGQVSPNATAAEWLAAGRTAVAELTRLRAAGQLIEIRINQQSP